MHWILLFFTPPLSIFSLSCFRFVFLFFIFFFLSTFFFFSQFFILCNLYLKAKSCVTIFVHITFLEFEFIVMTNCTLIVSLKKSNEKKINKTKMFISMPLHHYQIKRNWVLNLSYNNGE